MSTQTLFVTCPLFVPQPAIGVPPGAIPNPPSPGVAGASGYPHLNFEPLGPVLINQTGDGSATYQVWVGVDCTYNRQDPTALPEPAFALALGACLTLLGALRHFGTPTSRTRAGRHS